MIQSFGLLTTQLLIAWRSCSEKNVADSVRVKPSEVEFNLRGPRLFFSKHRAHSEHQAMSARWPSQQVYPSLSAEPPTSFARMSAGGKLPKKKKCPVEKERYYPTALL